MAAPPSKEKQVKRLENQMKKYSSNEKIMSRLNGRMSCLQGKKKK